MERLKKYEKYKEIRKSDKGEKIITFSNGIKYMANHMRMNETAMRPIAFKSYTTCTSTIKQELLSVSTSSE